MSITQIDGLGRVVATIQNYQDGVSSVGEPAADLITRMTHDAVGRRTRQIKRRPQPQQWRVMYDHALHGRWLEYLGSVQRGDRLRKRYGHHAGRPLGQRRAGNRAQ